MITALIHDGCPVDEVFSRVSRVLDRRPEDLLATAAVVVIDVEKSQVTFAMAGHPPPLILYPGAAVLVLDSANAPMLGVAATRPVSGTAAFPPESKLLMYTDGLVESRHRFFDEGIAALSELLEDISPLLAPEQLVDEAIRQMVLDSPANDDIAIVAIANTRITV